jgi:hypothetical protein
MNAPGASVSRVWVRGLQGFLIFAALFGLALVTLQGVTQAFFSWMIFGNVTMPASYSPEELHYIRFVYGVLGAVITGWMLTMALMVRHLSLDVTWVAMAIAIGVTVWFVVDSSLSVVMGYWQNAVLNLGFFIPIIVPLAVIMRQAPRR